MHVDPKVEQTQVAAGVVVHKYAAVHLKRTGHNEGRVPMLISDQRLERDVFGGLFGACDRTAHKIGASLQSKSGRRPDGDKIRLEWRARFSFVTAAALAGNSQA